MNWKWYIIILLLIAIFWSSAYQFTFGQSIYASDPTEITVVDGDTIRMGETRIRLHGVDAPEMRQAGGRDARSRLRAIIATGGVLSCVFLDRDRYQRFVAKCFTNKKIDIGGEMVRNGYAFAYQAFSRDYVVDEHFAKENRLGLWRGEPVMPWVWRRSRLK